MAKVREQNEIKLQQLETTIQDKLVQAQTRKEQIEQEQKEKLKTYVSIACFFFLIVVFSNWIQKCTCAKSDLSREINNLFCRIMNNIKFINI